MRCKVFISSEGFGHVIRSIAVMDELRRLIPGLEITVQTDNSLGIIRSVVDDVRMLDIPSPVRWFKKSSGSPDLEAIRGYLEGYGPLSSRFVEESMKDDTSYDFILSDYVYEAFEIGSRLGVPSFGMAHYTWDWFFSKLYPSPLPQELSHRWADLADRAARIYFPAFTPEEILSFHANSRNVPLIVRSMDLRPVRREDGAKVLLVVDSGANVLREPLKRALERLRPIEGWRIMARRSLITGGEGGAAGVGGEGGYGVHIEEIPDGTLLIDHIPSADLVVGRAGFNTMSECIACRVPMLLSHEALNPEMAVNVLAVKARNLGSFVDIQTLTQDFSGAVEDFLAGEYGRIRKGMDEHDLRCDGQKEIAADIVEYLRGEGRMRS